MHVNTCEFILSIRRPGFLRRYNDINDTTSRKQGDKNELCLLLRSSSGSSSALHIGSNPGHHPDLLGPRDAIPKALGWNGLVNSNKI